MKVRYIKKKPECCKVFTIGKIYEGVIEDEQLVVIDDYGDESVMFRSEYEEVVDESKS